MSNSTGRSRTEANTEVGHLEDLPDGCGCAEVWEHLSAARTRAADD